MKILLFSALLSICLNLVSSGPSKGKLIFEDATQGESKSFKI